MTDAHLRAIHAGAVALHAAAEAAGHAAITAASAALLAHIDAAIDSGGEMPVAEVEAPTGCQHPQELRQSTGTLSGVYVRCRGCGARLS